MRKLIIYVVTLLAAAVAVFFLAFGLGRSPSLERELARRSSGAQDQAMLSIESLRSIVKDEEPAGETAPEQAPPVTEDLGGDVTVVRYPIEEAGLVLLLDGDLLPGGRDSLSREPFARGIEGFFDALPAGVRTGVRVMDSGVPGDCGGTVLLRSCGLWGPGELKAALRESSPTGPRGLAAAIREGAADLASVTGPRALIVVTGGDEECGGIPCQAAADLEMAAAGVKVHVVVLRQRSYGDLFDDATPTWLSRMECIARKGGGELVQAAGARDLELALRRLASSLRPNITVRAFHATGREVEGGGVESRKDWGAALSPSSSPAETSERAALPAVFSVPGGEYDLRVWYHGLERRAARLAVGPAERLEVLVNFRAGELYLQARDVAGEEMVGDTSDFNCFWGAEVFEGGNLERDFGSSCGFPAYFVLRPGEYTVRLWKAREDHWLEKVVVREGETTVETVGFREE